mmetsp:Transcript_1130/g.2905  ORF Transcript_1130/g.2905 Transcript_1130/m.2905 type:complete len:94 (-) Transcript_1130:1856-2137(-)
MRATPRFSQCDSEWRDGKQMYMIKFDEWPVVVSIPRLSVVLYVGAWNTLFLSFCGLPDGFIQMVGSSQKSCFGNASSSARVRWSQRQPSTNSP